MAIKLILLFALLINLIDIVIGGINIINFLTVLLLVCATIEYSRGKYV